MPEHDDPLAEPARLRLFTALAALRRPATTAQLAEAVGRHPNRVRVHLLRLADAGLVERRTTPQPRGRPRDEWAIASQAPPPALDDEHYRDLSRWLARAVATESLDGIAEAGREIGRELAPATARRAPADALLDALAALGFAPRPQPIAAGVRYVLAHCPYRRAVAENQPAVCMLHRGITEGLLDRLDPAARLKDFVAKDPVTAGCLIDVASAPVAP